MTTEKQAYIKYLMDRGHSKEEAEKQADKKDRQTPYERTRKAVYATGNRWAIENFNATH